jgi:hypothetical protein
VVCHLKLLTPLFRCELLSYPNFYHLLCALVASTTLKKYTRLNGQYGLGVPSRRMFRVRGRVLALHIPIGSVPGSSVAGVLGNKLVTLGDPLSPRFSYIVYMLIWG